MRFLINEHKVANIGTLVMVLLYVISLTIYVLLRRWDYIILDAFDNGLIMAGMTELFLIFIVSWRVFLLNSFNWRYMEKEIIAVHGFGFYSRINYEQIKCIVIAAQDGYRNRYKYDKDRKKYAILASYSSEIYGRKIFSNQKLSIDPQTIDGLLCATYMKLEDLENLLLKTTVNVIITEDMLWYHKELVVPVLIKCSDRVMVSCRYDNYDGFKHLGFMEYLSLLPR